MLLLLLILLVGLAVLYAAHRRVAERIDALERMVDYLSHAAAAASREAPEPARPVAAVPTPIEPARVAVPDAAEQHPEPAIPAARETFVNLFERFVGGRLLIWIGGIALAIAGVFLVRYSIEIGLVTPPVRMALAGAFGLLLVAAGEAARRRPGALADPRIAQALVGAGIFVLYAATYGSLTLYGLITLAAASALMALITAAALFLALRHGAPTAVMGLTGGFLTPLLVGDPDASAVPLLAYLALLNAALFALAQRRGWTWLAAAAVILSFLWSAALLFSETHDALAAGAFIVALGIAASMAAPGEGRQLRLIQPAAIGLLQLAVLVARADLGLPAWALFGTLAVASLVLATRRPDYRSLPPVALLLALLLLLSEILGDPTPLTPWIAAAVTLLFAGFAWPRARREDERKLWTLVACAAFASPVIILRVGQPELLARPHWGLAMLLLAAGPATLAWRHRAEARSDGRPDLPLLAAAATMALLLFLAGHDFVARALLPAAWLVVATGLALGARGLGDRGLSVLALLATALGVGLAASLASDLWATVIASLLAEPALVTALPSPLDAFRLLVLPAALLLMIWRWTPRFHSWTRAVPIAAGIFFAGAAYIVFKQLFAIGSLEDFVARGLMERTLITQALFLAGWLLATRRVRLAGLGDVQPSLGAVVTGIAAARLIWFDLIIHNPAFTDQWVGPLPLLNLLLPAWIGGAAWLFAARRRASEGSVWLALFLIALIAGVMLLVRQSFHGAILTAGSMPLGERYGYSLTGLLLSIALLAAGVKLADKPLRFAGLVLLTATILKVFLVDAAALDGILRILSFLGLGVALIGVGKLYASVFEVRQVAR